MQVDLAFCAHELHLQHAQLFMSQRNIADKWLIKD